MDLSQYVEQTQAWDAEGKPTARILLGLDIEKLEADGYGHLVAEMKPPSVPDVRGSQSATGILRA